jgi:hypothetical protein
MMTTKPLLLSLLNEKKSDRKRLNGAIRHGPAVSLHVSNGGGQTTIRLRRHQNRFLLSGTLSCDRHLPLGIGRLPAAVHPVVEAGVSHQVK